MLKITSLVMLALTFARGFAPASCSSRTFAARTLSSSANPLLDQEALPKFRAIEASDLSPAVDQLLTDMKTKFDQLEKKIDPSKGVYSCSQLNVIPSHRATL